jgi:YesN/AraC family two-component response regulator
MMPGMTGTQLIKTIRFEHPSLAVVLASGYSELPEEDLAGLVRLSKPFKQADLAQALAASSRNSGDVLPFRTRQGQG